MHNFRVVCFLTVLFCLVVCVSANAEVSLETARATVEKVKISVKTVRARAQSQLENATSVLEKVESSKRDAEKAALKSQETATGNKEAAVIATNVKILSDEVVNLHSEAKQKLDTAVESLTGLLSEAQGLEGESDIQLTPYEDSSTDYTNTNNKATGLQTRATDLDNRITEAFKPVDDLYSKANDMADKAKEAQLKDAHVSAIVAVATIGTMLENAATTIGQIKGKKNEVSGIVGEMQTLKTNYPTVSDENINVLLQNADNALIAATDAVQNANSARAAIHTQKGLADATLAKVKDENQEVSEARNEASTAEACVRAADNIVPQLDNALQAATNSVTKAKDAKQKLETALSKATSATHLEQIVTNHEVKPLQDSVSSDVKAIQTMMGEADRIFQETENHKQTVHDIVEEMKTLKTTAKIESNGINDLCKNTEGELTKAANAVAKATNEKETMRQEKQLADAALKEVNAATEINEAQPHVAAATSCLAKVKENLAQLRIALQTAENSVAKANELKQKLMTILSTTTTASRTKEVKDAEKSDPPVAAGTEPDQKDATIQPTITNTEQPASKEPLNQGDNSADKLKDALINSAQNVPTTALTGGKAPAPGAKNDSAMTVSVPLLVALIASAVLQ